MVCYPYTAHGRTVHLSHSLLASRAPSISITLNALPITMVATEKPRSPGSPPPTIKPRSRCTEREIFSLFLFALRSEERRTFFLNGRKMATSLCA